jgi:hypothetical protein
MAPAKGDINTDLLSIVSPPPVWLVEKPAKRYLEYWDESTIHGGYQVEG